MNWLTLILKYLPALLQLVVSVQEVLKDAPGPVKKAVVLQILEAKPADLPAMVDVVADALKKHDAYPIPPVVAPPITNG